MSKPHILSFATYDAWDMEAMNQNYIVHPMPDSGDPMELEAETRSAITAFAFKGHSNLGAEIMDAFPNLALVANYGVGYDTIDVGYAQSKGIRVTNTPDVLTDDVADLAVGMLIALCRDIPGSAQWVTSGNWANSGAYPLQRTVTGRKVGIVGLGRIGRAIADRLQAFKSDTHYYSRSEKETPGWTYHNNVDQLAAAVEILIVCVSSEPGTAKIISPSVLSALGADGVLVNISRGATVDEEALLSALKDGTIRAAALDVFNNEPKIDTRFMQLDNVLLQPHQSSATIETRKKMGQLQRDNLAAFFAGDPLVTMVV